MRTQFSESQLAEPGLAAAEQSLRACVHCGICTATCPTYVLLADERDGPRGRIAMMQQMLETGGPPPAETVLHLDRCLSCLACRTACPSNVDYARLIDAARAHIAEHYRRPWTERLLRQFVSHAMSRTGHVRAGITLARAFRPLLRFLPGKLRAIAALGADLRPAPQRRKAPGRPKANCKTAVLPGCVQAAVAPQIDETLLRVLERDGSEPGMLAGVGCCGALAHHLGKTAESRSLAKTVIGAFERAEASGVVALTISATGCAAHIRDYPHHFRGDGNWEARAQHVADRLKDVSELLRPVPPAEPHKMRVAFHEACSAQNVLKLSARPEALLSAAGYHLLAIPEGHLCCGSAGSYSLLQPELSSALRERKLANIALTRPDIIATGNIGCQIQLSKEGSVPVVHYVQLLDWVQGGPAPAGLRGDVLADQARGA
ncbi:MAG: glycolate oxidase subunit GlcF [Alphaproteobacteria bacterium]|nr:glycolate oxidase subunit GlcF [Alphaproteobacteria bacterium]